jgi:hypothetical protein
MTSPGDASASESGGSSGMSDAGGSSTGGEGGSSGVGGAGGTAGTGQGDAGTADAKQVDCNYPSAACGGLETCSIDLLSDPSHCGRCGHSCLGGACFNGLCQVVSLDVGEGHIEKLAESADGRIVFVWTGAVGQIKEFDPASGQVSTLAQFSVDEVIQGNIISELVIDGDIVVALVNAMTGGAKPHRDQVVAWDLKESAPQPQVLSSIQWLSTVTAFQGNAYWIEHIDTTSGEPETVLKGQSLAGGQPSTLRTWHSTGNGLVGYQGGLFFADGYSTYVRYDIDAQNESVFFDNGENMQDPICRDSDHYYFDVLSSGMLKLSLQDGTFEVMDIDIGNWSYWRVDEFVLVNDYVFAIDEDSVTRTPVDGSAPTAEVVDLESHPDALATDGVSLLIFTDDAMLRLALP